MPAEVRWNEYNGPPPGTKTTGIVNCNFGNIDAPNLDYTQYPIRRGQCSYDKWWKIDFYAGSFNKVSNFRFYRSDAQGGPGPSLPTGVSVKAEAGSSQDLSYTQPSTNPISANECPTTLETALVVGPPERTSYGETYFIHVQLQTTNEAPVGDLPTMYFTFVYDEE